MAYDGKPEQTLREGAVHLTNEARTCELGDAGLTQRRSPSVPCGYTYFVRVDDAIKIGSATDFKRRLHALQTAHEKPIDVLAVVPASVADEYTTHQLFAHLRIRGEWFRADQELLYFIERLAADAGGPRIIQKHKAGNNPIKELIAIRARLGADTPIGQRCSNAGEQIKNYPGETPFQQDMLQRLIRESHDELSRLSRQRE